MKKKSLNAPKKEVDLFALLPTFCTAVAAILLFLAICIAFFSVMQFTALGRR